MTARTTIPGRVVPEASGGIGAVADAGAGATRAAGAGTGVDVGPIRDAFFVRFDRVCFVDVLCARTTSFLTSVDTSSIQRTPRPARPAGILTACFDTATLCPTRACGNSRACGVHWETAEKAERLVT